MDEATKELVRDWLTRARHDLQASRVLAGSENPLLDAAIYHCQQAAEKAVMAWLQSEDDPFPKTHDIENLVEQAAKLNPDFQQLAKPAAVLTPYVFLQSFNGSQWNLAQANYAGGRNYLAGRFQKYRDALAYAITHRAPDTVQANGTVTGEMLATGPANAFDLFIISLLTRPAAPAPQIRPLGPQPNDGGPPPPPSGNVGAYAWLPLPIPADAVSMSFDFKIDGDWRDDSLAAALNGSNVLLLAASQVETNVTLNSGLIDVTTYVGKTNEFFVGIIGGTSTNALLTVQNVAFHTAAPPSLQAEASSNGLKVSWPLTAQNFNLESTTNLAVTNSWMAVTNVPAVVDLQNTVTNSVSGGARFYRLKK